MPKAVRSNMVSAALIESRGWASAIEQYNLINNQFIKPSTLSYLFYWNFKRVCNTKCRYEKFYTNIMENKHSINEVRRNPNCSDCPCAGC